MNIHSVDYFLCTTNEILCWWKIYISMVSIEKIRACMFLIMACRILRGYLNDIDVYENTYLFPIMINNVDISFAISAPLNHLQITCTEFKTGVICWQSDKRKYAGFQGIIQTYHYPTSTCSLCDLILPINSLLSWFIPVCHHRNNLINRNTFSGATTHAHHVLVSTAPYPQLFLLKADTLYPKYAH